jgi:hypothetical protein
MGMVLLPWSAQARATSQIFPVLLFDPSRAGTRLARIKEKKNGWHFSRKIAPLRTDWVFGVFLVRTHTYNITGSVVGVLAGKMHVMAHGARSPHSLPLPDDCVYAR